MGAIEIPGGNEPIMLHRDGPTMGGYALIGVIARADLDSVAQYMPQSPVYFKETTRDEALALWAKYREDLAAIPARLVAA